MPTPRPLCRWCGRPLPYWTTDTETPEGTARVFAGWRGYHLLFERLSCALAFASAAYLGGVRASELKKWREK